jgi:hypothetical protein
MKTVNLGHVVLNLRVSGRTRNKIRHRYRTYRTGYHNVNYDITIQEGNVCDLKFYQEIIRNTTGFKGRLETNPIQIPTLSYNTNNTKNVLVRNRGSGL